MHTLSRAIGPLVLLVTAAVVTAGAPLQPSGLRIAFAATPPAVPPALLLPTGVTAPLVVAAPVGAPAGIDGRSAAAGVTGPSTAVGVLAAPPTSGGSGVISMGLPRINEVPAAAFAVPGVSADMGAEAALTVHSAPAAVASVTLSGIPVALSTAVVGGNAPVLPFAGAALPVTAAVSAVSAPVELTAASASAAVGSITSVPTTMNPTVASSPSTPAAVAMDQRNLPGRVGFGVSRSLAMSGALPADAAPQVAVAVVPAVAVVANEALANGERATPAPAVAPAPDTVEVVVTAAARGLIAAASPARTAPVQPPVVPAPTATARIETVAVGVQSRATSPVPAIRAEAVTEALPAATVAEDASLASSPIVLAPIVLAPIVLAQEASVEAAAPKAPAVVGAGLTVSASTVAPEVPAPPATGVAAGVESAPAQVQRTRQPVNQFRQSSPALPAPFQSLFDGVDGAISQPLFGMVVLGMLLLGVPLARRLQTRRARTAAFAAAALPLQEAQRAQGGLLQQLTFSQAIAHDVGEGIVVVDGAGRITFANPAAGRMLGWTESTLVGRPLDPLLGAGQMAATDLLELVVRSGEPARLDDTTVTAPDGSTLPVSLSAAPLITNGTQAGAVLAVHDITSSKAQTDALEHRALHDALTGLPNRALLHDRLRHALQAAQRTGRPVALLVMDLDGFKPVNDTLGHSAGDLLLQHVGKQAQSVLRASDTLARFGGDEFVVVLPGANRAGALLVAEQVRQAIGQPLEIEGRSVRVGVSIGIAFCPEHGADAETLLRHADAAMYMSKRGARGVTVYATEAA